MPFYYDVVDSWDHFPFLESIVDYLSEKTQNNNRHFLRLQAIFTMAQIASMQRVSIEVVGRGEIPINTYVINLSPSGTGKGHSTNILEKELTAEFRDIFQNTTFPLSAESNILDLANNTAVKKATDPAEELERLKRDFDSAGPLVYSFDSGTGPAIKQIRQKLLAANLGSLNLVIDEIGSNITKNTDLLDMFLELYDMGYVKQKIIKNTAESLRTEEIDGSTPANVLLYGTPSKLLNGGRVEDDFFEFLETGYARRSLFCYAKDMVLTPPDVSLEDLYNQLLLSQSNRQVQAISDKFSDLADPIYSNTVLTMDKDVTLEMLKYKTTCEREAEKLTEFQDMLKAELLHRYFKATKLAGQFAFIDGSPSVDVVHMRYAIKVVEESGQQFAGLLNRERPYERLCRFIVSAGRPLTQADLVEDLPSYKGTISQKNEMMTLATAYAYNNHMVIKKSVQNGIEFFTGSTLEETNLDEMVVSYSNDISTGYTNHLAPFSKLDKLTQAGGMHWCNHHSKTGQRSLGSMQAGFNMIVLDVENTISIDAARELLKDYTYHIYTTKRHQFEDNGDRFRVLLPINYVLELECDDFSKFMENVYSWLPFEVDTAPKDWSRKWASNMGTHYYNEGKLVDALPFIPDTTKNLDYLSSQESLRSLSALEKWFVSNSAEGNRNQMLFRYASMLESQGIYDYNSIAGMVHELNQKLDNKLEIDEVNSTVLKTISKRMMGA